jgi:hypothetical protein
MDYTEIVPALPPGIGLVEFTPRTASADRGVCFQPEAIRHNPYHHSRRLTACNVSVEPIGAARQSIGAEEFTGSESAKRWNF